MTLGRRKTKEAPVSGLLRGMEKNKHAPSKAKLQKRSDIGSKKREEGGKKGCEGFNKDDQKEGTGTVGM